MDRVKFSIESFEQTYEEYTLFGEKLMIRTWLTQREKEECALEFVNMACVIDQDKEVAYIGYQERFAKAFCFAKYYTNIDVDSFLEIANDTTLVDDIIRAVQHIAIDWEITESEMDSYAYKVVDIFRQYHCLPTKIVNAFGSILDGTDLAEQTSENKELNDIMIDVLNAKNEKNESNAKIALFSKFAKKNN